MAYQSRGREPFLDSNLARAIERRGMELLGLALLSLAAALTALAVSYSPEDPSWISATDAPVANWLGQPGATVAATLFMIVGHGIWAFPAVLGSWGLRLLLHRGQGRAVGRLVFAPIWIALAALYAATLTPGEAWAPAHSFGMGGLFGDTVLAALLNILPLSAAAGLKVLSLALALALLGLGGFVAGFDRAETAAILRFLRDSLRLTLAGGAALARGATALSGRAACAVRDGQAARAGRRAAAAEGPGPARITESREDEAARIQPTVRRAVPVGAAEPAPAAAAEGRGAGGLLSRVPGLRRRDDSMPEPELVEAAPDDGFDPGMPGDARLRRKIADVVRNRVRHDPDLKVEKTAPLTRGRGRGPAPLLASVDAATGLPPEPPLTGGPRPDVAGAVPEPGDTEMEVGDPVPDRDGRAQPAGPEAEAFAPRIPSAAPKKVVQHTPRRTPPPSQRAKDEAQPALQFEEAARPVYELPPLGLLANPDNIERHHLSDDALEENARMLENVLDDYGVKGEIVSVRPGPVVTMYELEPAPGLKASRVIGLADDIARSMSALSARVSTVPGRSA